MPATRRPSRSAVWSTAPVAAESAARQPSGAEADRLGPEAGQRPVRRQARRRRAGGPRRGACVDSSRRRSTSPAPDVEVERRGARPGARAGAAARPRRPACIRWTTRVRSPSASTPDQLAAPPDAARSRGRPGPRAAGSAVFEGGRVVDRARPRRARPASARVEALGERLQLGQLRHGRSRGAVAILAPDERARHAPRATDAGRGPHQDARSDRPGARRHRRGHRAGLRRGPRAPLRGPLLVSAVRPHDGGAAARLRRQDLRGDRLPGRRVLVAGARAGRPTGRSPRAPTSSTWS